MATASPILVVVASYLVGSIPFSFLVARLMAGTDIRRQGSFNVGATNVARTAGKRAGCIALLLDISKGYAAVALAEWIVLRPDWPIAAATTGGPIQSREFWIALAGIIAVLGHMFPVWLRFHGGKGVATATGVFLALGPIVIAAAAIAFLIVLITTRLVSLASMFSAASVPIFFHLLAPGAPFWRVVIAILISIAVILKHHANIARLVAGTEQRMGERRKDE
jgi:acyl phosphate:glycerol-3-phosphate acyltransferase